MNDCIHEKTFTKITEVGKLSITEIFCVKCGKQILRYETVKKDAGLPAQ